MLVQEQNTQIGIIGKPTEIKAGYIREITFERQKKALDATKKRLYAYPQIKENVRQYKLDIENIQVENFGRSKSIVVFQPRGGEPFSVEDKRAAAIVMLEQKIARDQREIDEMDRALSKIKNEPYYQIIELRYFQCIKDRYVISKKVHCSESTVSRNLSKLLYQLSVILYGADALH